MEIKKTWGFMFLLKHSDTFYLSNLLFSFIQWISLLLYFSDNCCNKNKKQDIPNSWVFFMLKSGSVLNTPTTNLLAQLISAKFKGFSQSQWDFYYLRVCVCAKCVCLSAKKGSAQPSMVLILPMLPLQYYKSAQLLPICLHASKT